VARQQHRRQELATERWRVRPALWIVRFFAGAYPFDELRAQPLDAFERQLRPRRRGSAQRRALA